MRLSRQSNICSFNPLCPYLCNCVYFMPHSQTINTIHTISVP
nr:MAG TPA: protein of unknown function (DUF1764) [Bacteriophage sp.]